MLISAFAALVLFAAPEAAQSGGAETASAAAPAAAEAKPATKKVCTTIEVAGSNLPKKKCRTVPVKAETPKPTEEAKSETTATQ